MGSECEDREVQKGPSSTPTAAEAMSGGVSTETASKEEVATPATGPRVPSSVIVHPLVLLSVVDHFNRMGKIGNQKRVVGVLLGSWVPGTKDKLDISNSFAVPFDEDG